MAALERIPAPDEPMKLIANETSAKANTIDANATAEAASLTERHRRRRPRASFAAMAASLRALDGSIVIFTPARWTGPA
jgi:hypothetical protein